MSNDTYILYAGKKIEEASRELGVDFARGLTEREAAARQKKYGKNVLRDSEAAWRRILIRQIRSPFMYLLSGAAALSFFFGEAFDAALIALFIFINAALGFFQEFRSERTLALLKRYLVSYAVVRRGGSDMRVDKSDVVPGDVVLLQSGDIVPADVRVFDASRLEVNESALTGESVSVWKRADPIENVTSMHEAGNICFAGTTIVSGQAAGVAVATGTHSALGAIAALAGANMRESGFDKGIRQITSMILKVVAATFLCILAIKFFLPARETPFLEFVIFSIALAVSVVPEGLPLVMTFTLSRGAKALARNKVVVRRLSAIEDLGSIEVLCTDKTGTITENRLRVSDIYGVRRDAVLATARLGMLGHAESPGQSSFYDALWADVSREERAALDSHRLISCVPFDPLRRRSAAVVRKGHADELVVVGAPEEILPLCEGSKIGNDADRAQVFMRDEGSQGRRTVAVAKKRLAVGYDGDIIREEHGLRFVGCVSFFDPMKDTAVGAIQKAERLGVQVKILTGDSADVATAVARQAGLIGAGEEALSGAAFDAMSDEEKHAAVERCHVFARVSPSQKYDIVHALERRYEVGFLGEGMNDAPALKAATIGLAVENASDVARESADIVLLNKDVSVIVNGIEEGRRVFANSVKYLKATLASNFGNFYAVVAASFLAGFLPMLPVQILLLNLLSDFPMMAIAEDSVEADDLRRPRHYDIRDIALIAVLLGFVSTVFDFLFFGLFYRFGPEALRTNWFMASIFTELLLLFSIRTHRSMFRAGRPGGMVFLLTGIAAVITLALPLTRFGQFLFHLTPPSPVHLLWMLGLLVAYLACTEAFKLAYYRRSTSTI